MAEMSPWLADQILTPALAPLMVEGGPFTVMGGACRACRGVTDRVATD